jgi:hypothetical protein
MPDLNPHNFNSLAQFRRLAEERLYLADYPEMIWDAYTYEIISDAEEAAAAIPADSVVNDRMVYVTLPDDYSWFRLGQGQWDRPLAHLTAYLMERYGYSARRREGGKRFWPQPLPTFKLIDANGGRLGWFPLLENLTSRQARAVERALFTRYGLRKNGGLWENDTEN